MILSDEAEIEVVGEASNGREAVDAAGRLHPDVVVMDIRMPVMDGVEATRRLATGGEPGPRVLVLTTFDTDEHVVAALRAGASGFLLKDVAPADFVAAIRVVAGGEALIAPAVTRRLLERFAHLPMPGDAAYAEQLKDLTERELEVLKLVAQGISNREIAERLVLAEPTVKTHVSPPAAEAGPPGPRAARRARIRGGGRAARVGRRVVDRARFAAPRARWPPLPARTARGNRKPERRWAPPARSVMS